MASTQHCQPQGRVTVCFLCWSQLHASMHLMLAHAVCMQSLADDKNWLVVTQTNIVLLTEQLLILHYLLLIGVRVHYS